jgi:hypothetical protein
MPKYLTIPALQPYNEITPPVLEEGILGYSWGSRSGYLGAYASPPLSPPTGDLELGETMPSNGTAGLQFNLPSGILNRERSLTWSYSFPTAPSSGVMALEGAITDLDSQYAPIDPVAAIILTGEVRSVAASLLAGINFIRVKVTSTVGGGTIIAKFSI